MRNSEWGWQKPILSTRLKNAIQSVGGYVFNLKNIRLNGNNVGCCGFIRNGDIVVYVRCDETEGYGNTKYLVRYARDGKDYTGQVNQFADSFETVVNKIKDMLEHPERNFYRA